MATLKFTFDVPGDSPEMFIDSVNEVRVPTGKAVASTIQAGDVICMFPDGGCPMKVANVEEVVE